MPPPETYRPNSPKELKGQTDRGQQTPKLTQSEQRKRREENRRRYEDLINQEKTSLRPDDREWLVKYKKQIAGNHAKNERHYNSLKFQQESEQKLTPRDERWFTKQTKKKDRFKSWKKAKEEQKEDWLRQRQQQHDLFFQATTSNRGDAATSGYVYASSEVVYT